MFDLWRAQRAKTKLDRAYEKDADKLRKAGKEKTDDYGYFMSEWSNEASMAEDSVNSIVTARLIAKANKLDLPLPPYPAQGGQQNECWYKSYYQGYRYLLSAQGRASLRDSIRKEQRERFEAKARWVTLCTGIIGATIGLVSVLTNLLVKLLAKH